MADEERQDLPEGQEPEGQEPVAQEPEGQEPVAQEPEAGAPGEPGEAASEEPASEEPAREEPAREEPIPQEPAPEEPVPDVPVPGEPVREMSTPEEPASGERPSEAAAPQEGPPPPRQRRGRGRQEGQQEEVIPGAHLEPDLVLEEEGAAAEGGEYAEAGVEYAEVEGVEVEPAAEREEAEQPVAREPLDLAADARYAATGKRKTAVARVILRPGDGVYRVNGRHLDQFFPRVRLQRMAQQPLETAGYNGRMDVVARIHGGGVSAQAGALRHGIARALVEADPSLRVELKRRGFLTRDPREKERKKAGLKKARKRPQFSKR
jgi:small subunit ribosomal protein S9